MSDEEGPFPRNKGETPGRQQGMAWCCLPLLVASVGLSACGVVRSQAADIDPVERLRHALQATYPNPAARDRQVKECLAELRSLSDLQRAAVLVEWCESCPGESSAAVDRANQEALLEALTVAVRGVLRPRGPAAAATIDWIARTAEQARASGEPLPLFHRFGPELADVVIQGPSSLRAAAARTLGQIEPSVYVAVPALEELLRAGEAELRLAAADGLAHLMQNALQALGGAGSQRPAPRGELVLVAGSILPAVHHGLDDDRLEVRRRCLETIGLAAVALSRLIEDANPPDGPSFGQTSPAGRRLESEREELRPLLVALRDQGPILARCVRDNDVEVRVLAHKALEEMGHARGCWARRCATVNGPEEDALGDVLREAVHALAAALAHPDLRVRRSALDALEMMGPLALPALPALARVLHDPDRFLRWSAVRTLGKLGPTARDAVDELRLTLQDPDTDVRRAAGTVLLHIGSSSPP